MDLPVNLGDLVLAVAKSCYTAGTITKALGHPGSYLLRSKRSYRQFAYRKYLTG